jgi:hypothetical protein
VGRINKQKMTFKQRENIELFLKGCGDYGLKTQDLFQVNDLFEGKNLYMVVDNLYSLGGLVSKLISHPISEHSHLKMAFCTAWGLNFGKII